MRISLESATNIGWIILVVIFIIIVIVRWVNESRKCKRSSDKSDEFRHLTGTERGENDFYAHAFKDKQSNVVYIRHGHDESSGHAHDQRLTEEGWTEAQKLARELVKKHGVPSAIYYSPFDRTTDTAKAMYQVLRDEVKSPEIKIRIEPRLGKYFTENQRSKPRVSHATIERGMIVPANKKAFKEGLDQHHANIKKKYPGQVVWNITHAIGVNHHLKRISGQGQTIEYLQHVVGKSSVRSDNAVASTRVVQ